MAKINKIILALILLCLIGMSAVIVMSTRRNERSSEGPIVLSYAESQSGDYPTVLGATKFAGLVKEKTDGRIEILVYDGGSLGTEKEVLEQMKYGGVDITEVSLASLANYCPKLNVLQLPYIYRDADHMWKVLDGDVGEGFLNSLEDNDFVGLSWYDSGARNFYSYIPIDSMDDLNGLRIRVQDSNLMADTIYALGGIPTRLDYKDVYSALQSREIQVAENNWPSYMSMVHYEVAPYYLEDMHQRQPEIQVMSRSARERLSKDDYDIIVACAKESAEYERKLWTQKEEEAKYAAIKAGVVVNELSEQENEKFQKAVDGVYYKYCGQYEELINEIKNVK